MTLPPYSVSASNTEQILGREGDRDGIDVIVNMATEENDEALRDEEMETLYQIREARRRQIAEREERRSERAAARQRRDNSALAEINERTRAANDDTTVDDLRQHASNTQDRRLRSVSSVSYADLGIARHDGSRVDVSNVDAENTGLLSDAASIGRTSRDMTPSRHRRDLSVGSFVSVDSGIPSPAYPGSRSSSRVDVSRTLSAEDPGLGSSPEMVEADLGDESMPPPEYEEVSLGEDDAQQPPQYAEERAEQLQVPETSTGRQRSSSYTGPLPDIVIGEAFSVDLGEAPTR
ncbi:hypothetical protein K4F52_008480 [Lecanicillium sp. MT-2017a]|nr:hypothetical protein K4F52_008480 [Lecanicillium sp. MT-2017a]